MKMNRKATSVLELSSRPNNTMPTGRLRPKRRLPVPSAAQTDHGVDCWRCCRPHSEWNQHKHTNRITIDQWQPDNQTTTGQPLKQSRRVVFFDGLDAAKSISFNDGRRSWPSCGPERTGNKKMMVSFVCGHLDAGRQTTGPPYDSDRRAALGMALNPVVERGKCCIDSTGGGGGGDS